MGDPFDDYSDAASVTSTSSAEPSPPTADDIFQMQRERAAMEFALAKQTAEKERRRQAKKAQQAAAQQYYKKSSPKKSGHKSKLSNMSPIAE